MARRYTDKHAVITPEAANIVCGGGFPSSDVPKGQSAAQRAIFHVRRALETVALEGLKRPLRYRTLDGLAYWSGSGQSFSEEFGIDFDTELNRSWAVVPPQASGYEKKRARSESISHAREIDRCIARAWRGHPQSHDG